MQIKKPFQSERKPIHAGDLSSARWLFQAVALPNGSALAIGGLSIAKGGVLNSTEIFIPAKDNGLQGSWSEVAAMNTPRQDFGAVLLDDGTVLAVGGFMASTEIYDPAKVQTRIFASKKVHAPSPTIPSAASSGSWYFKFGAGSCMT